MNCNDVETRLQSLCQGRLQGSEARRVRVHLASCTECAALLTPLDRVELLPMLDVEVEPSPDLGERFAGRLRAHRELKNRPGLTSVWTRFWKPAWPLSWHSPRQVTAALLVASLVGAAVFFAVTQGPDSSESGITETEINLAANLPLLEEMDLIQNLDLLENFEEIQAMSRKRNDPRSIQ